MDILKEKQIVETMVALYCRKKHGKGIADGACEDCSALKDYAAGRLADCPFGNEKPFCSHCKIHCYKPDMRQKIKEVMRFSGPRILIYHPVLVLRHAGGSIRNNRKNRVKKGEKHGSKEK